MLLNVTEYLLNITEYLLNIAEHVCAHFENIDVSCLIINHDEFLITIHVPYKYSTNFLRFE